MPNHYTVIALCGPGWDFDCEAFNAAEFNLCNEVDPMPNCFDGINIGSCLMPDGSRASHWRDTDDGPVAVDVAPLVEEHGSADALEWQREHWGVKWGTYGTKAVNLGGDGSPVLIHFQSPWGSPTILDKIGVWLKSKFGFTSIVWSGFDPYDDLAHWLNGEGGHFQ